MPSPMLRRSSSATSGFTLIELMIVVVIIGVLAAVAIPSFTAYVQRSRMAEAFTFLGEIKQRQEAYRAEYGQYASTVTDLASYGDYVPATLPTDGNARTWPENSSIPEWVQLGAVPDGPTRFQYGVLAGLPGAAPAGYNFPANEFTFVARARGDLDGDGDEVIVEVLSHRAAVWISEASGWE